MQIQKIGPFRPLQHAIRIVGPGIMRGDGAPGDQLVAPGSGDRQPFQLAAVDQLLQAGQQIGGRELDPAVVRVDALTQKAARLMIGPQHAVR